MPDVSNCRNGSSGKRFRRRAPPANRSLPLGNNKNDTEERYEICNEGCGDASHRDDRASERRPNRSGQVEFDPGLSAEAAARSSFCTNSGRIAAVRGFEGVSGGERKCQHQRYPWRHDPAMVKIARMNATPIIHDSVKRISLRRSTISPAEPAGRARRK